MLIFDAHLDLSMNALEWNRDLSDNIQNIRLKEAGLTDKPDRGKSTVTFEELRKGNIGLVVATLIARYVKKGNSLPGWHSPEQAWAQTQGQLAWYKAMEKKGELKQIKDRSSLRQHLANCLDPQEEANPIGYILSLEGADSLYDLASLEEAFRQGLRAVGPAHYGPGTYAFGTASSGSIGKKGKALLKRMEELGIILDVTHLCDVSFWETINSFNGPIWASHSNCRSLVPDDRQFADDQIRVLIERGAVIGAAFDAWMLVPNWKRGIDEPRKRKLFMNSIIDHWDHICQIAGNADHIGIGSDLDGGFGKEQSPADLETIADLQLFGSMLKHRGYSTVDIEKVMFRNWTNFLLETWQ